MDLCVKLGVLLVVSITVDASDISVYIPQIAKDIRNHVTDKTFVLVQPNCIFNQYVTTNVWLVIALNKSFSTLNDSELVTPVPYSSYRNGLHVYYHTLLVSAGQYPCLPSNSTTITVIQIGSESCKGNQFCNGPLSNNQTYRVRFVLLNSTGIFDKTQWSSEISLKQEKQFQDSSIWPSGRSGGMIVLTSILSVLLAILLICLIAAFVFGSQDICWKRSLINKKRIANMDFMSPSMYRSRYDNVHLAS